VEIKFKASDKWFSTRFDEKTTATTLRHEIKKGTGQIF